MADHKAEQILQAVTTMVTGLATTGANVERGQFSPVDAAITAALTVTHGALTPVGEPNVAFQDATLEVVITAHAKGADGTVESTINQIAKEVYIAMLADHTLGLGFVHDTTWQGNDAPQLEVAEQPIMTMAMRFGVMFRHAYTDPSA